MHAEEFPRMHDDDAHMLHNQFRLVLHHLHRLAVKCETVTPNVAELIAREVCRVLALVLRNRAPQFLTECVGFLVHFLHSWLPVCWFAFWRLSG